MGTLGTFDTFTTARLGIYAAQQGLKVTGNNISNINTAGYTRQRIDQVSFKTGVHDRYRSMMDNHIGNGALVTNVNQIRDPFLDIRYRTTSTDTSYYDTKLSGLQEIASILDEVGKGIKDGDNMSKGDGLLYAQLQTLAEELRAFSSGPTKGQEILVRGAASSLTSLFNNYAEKLENLRQHYDADFKQNITAANKVLANIRDLNRSIRECEINGDNALEMRDERNRQIDQLAEYMSIKVQYSMEDVGAGILVEKLTILMGGSNPDPSVETDSSILVDGMYCTQLSVPDEKPTLNKYKDDPKNEYLNGYLHLKEVPLTEDELKALNDDGITPLEACYEDGTAKKNDAGKQLYLMGTNDAAAEGIVTEKNDNYTVQLGKLLDDHDNEWESSETIWKETDATPDGVKASYQYAISFDPDELKAGNIITIKGTEKETNYTLTEADVKDAAALAAALAKQLTSADYDITSDEKGNIIFTAKNVGVIGGTNEDPAAVPPQAQPELELAGTTDEDKDGKDNITLGKIKTITNGANKDETLPKGTSVDENGTETSYAYTEVAGKFYQVTIETKHTHEIALDDNDLHGELQALRELLTEEGEFCSEKDKGIDENAAIKRGIPYYQKSFDLLAQKFAEAYNELNTGYMLNQKGNYIDKDGNELLLENEPISKYNGLTDDQEAFLDGKNMTVEQWLEASCTGYAVNKDGNYVNNEGTVLTLGGTPISQNTPLTEDQQNILDGRGETLEQYLTNYKPSDSAAVKMGGPLFSNHNDGDDTTGITAANITISHSWSHGAVELIPKFEVLFADNENPNGIAQSTQNINANHMVSMIDKALKYNPQDLTGSDAMGPLLFEGSFNDMFSNLMGVQAEDASMTNVRLITSNTTLVELDSAREGVSGVDLNDEAMNMMQYQKAYSAACRLMTVIDEALDRLINNTGVVGR